MKIRPFRKSARTADFTKIVAVLGILLAGLAIGASGFLNGERGGNSTVSVPTMSTSIAQQSNSGNSSALVAVTSTQTSTQSSDIALNQTTSTSSPSSPLEQSNTVTTWKNYLGNFSEITVQYNETGLANSTFSYQVIGHSIINSTKFTEVKLTVVTAGSTSESSLIGWFNPEGNATMITEGGYNFTGSFAKEATTEFVSAFEVGFFTPENIALLTTSNNLGTSLQRFGSTQLEVTSYSSSIHVGETSEIQIGNLPGTNLDLLTYYVIQSGSSEQLGFRLLSLTSF